MFQVSFPGTAFICNPIALVTQNISQNKTVKGVIIGSFVGIFQSLLFSNARKFKTISPCWSFLGYVLGIFLAGLINSDIGYISCSLEQQVLDAKSALLQAPAAFFAILGSYYMTVTALSVTQLLAPAINFTAQIFLFPDRFSWSSAVGIMFTVLAVLVQMQVVRGRERQSEKQQKEVDPPQHQTSLSL